MRALKARRRAVLEGPRWFRRTFFFPQVLWLLLLLPSCTAPPMSVEEAGQVAVSMQDRPFLPPPRRVSDVLDALRAADAFDPEITRKLRKTADRALPPMGFRAAPALFYARRGLCAREIGRSAQALADLRKALSLALDENGERVLGLSPMQHAWILGQLGNMEALYGNFDRAIELEEEAVTIHAGSHHSFSLLTMFYGITGDFEAMERAADQGIRLCRYKKAKGSPNPWLEIHIADMEAERLEARGRYVQAEPFRRESVERARRDGRQNFPRAYLMRRTFLAENLEGQGRFVEAEIEHREALEETVALCGRRSAHVGISAVYLGKNLLSQGRLDEAETLLRAAVGILERSGLSNDSAYMVIGKALLGEILFCRGDPAAAGAVFHEIGEGIEGNRRFYEQRVLRMPSVLISFLETGRTEKAAERIFGFYEEFAGSLGAESLLTAEMQGLKGMAHAAQGETERALKDLSAAVPLLLQERAHDSFVEMHTTRHIVGAYIDLLYRRHGQEMRAAEREALSERIFQACQGLVESAVHLALGASGARAAAVDPDLADLVRKDQDLSMQVHALRVTLADRVTASLESEDSERVGALKEALDRLDRARGRLRLEIEERFPRYADLRSTRVPGYEEIQKALAPGEALIVLHAWEKKTFAWAVPKQGTIRFAMVRLGAGDLEARVSRLRKTLAPEPETFGEIPPFDLAGAHDLYARLLGPLEEGFRSASRLLVVAAGPLGPLPFSVLPTEPPRLNAEEPVLFSRYQDVPWLIRRASITRLPSAASLIQLRSLPPGSKDRTPFAGFGDPIFSPEQIARASSDRVEKAAEEKTAAEAARIAVRGIRLTRKGDMDDERIASLRLEHLTRLPDTAEEIRQIADCMNADSSRDVFLGKEASERRVRSMDLSDRRVIAFASHALLPGDLDGLRQPAIALSSPAVTGDEGDGLLTMEEILRLRLDADWTVLSACNTGAAEGAGAEAVSGLGRTFFYAGSRALLVSMWPVETTSARELTTGVFRMQQESPGLPRAEALRRSMISLLDGPGFRDPKTGKIVARYAHPFFWAPFVLVGEGGG